jgi:hypothetical protein
MVMKNIGPLKMLVAIFAGTLVVYLGIFYGIEHFRTGRGPWRVAFAGPGGSGTPMLIINELGLKIANVRIRFPGSSAPQTNVVIIFDRPQNDAFPVPFGECVFMDGQTQPGTVTLNLFNHEIQLLPRMLTIDKKDYPWKSDTTLDLRP